jgi:hypothetical protein
MQRILSLLCSDILVSLSFYKHGNHRVKVLCQVNPELALVEARSCIITDTASVDTLIADIQKLLKSEMETYRHDLKREQASLDRKTEMLRKFDAIIREESGGSPESRRKLQVMRSEEDPPPDLAESLEDLI